MFHTGALMVLFQIEGQPLQMPIPLKLKEKVFNIHGTWGYKHASFWLSSYMCDLNPVELAWARIKMILRKHNVTSDLSLKKLLHTTSDAIRQVTQEDHWCFCQHSDFLVKQYKEKDGGGPDEVALSSASVMTVKAAHYVWWILRLKRSFIHQKMSR